MQSHPVSVMGAVRKPGIFQIRGSKTLLEILSLAEGLADDAGEEVIILRRTGQTNAPGSVSEESERRGRIFPATRLEESERPAATDAGTDKSSAFSQNVAPGKFEGPPRFDRSQPQSRGISGETFVKVSRGRNRVCGGSGGEGQAVSQ